MRVDVTALVTSLLVLGCANAIEPYRPVRPHRAQTQDADVAILQAQIAGSFQFALVMRGAPGVRLERALLAPSAARPCREGLRDVALTVDEKLRWLRPVPIDGRHDVIVTFPQDAGLDVLTQRPALDLVLDTPRGERCVRVPVSGPEPELAWRRSFDWSVSYAARVARPSEPLGAVEDRWSFDAGFGRWLGPLRVMAELGAGATDCRSDCPPARNEEKGFYLIALRGSLDTYIYEGTGYGLAAGLWYGYHMAWRVNADSTRRDENSHGPGAALRFDLTRVWPPGFQNQARQGGVGLELSLGRLRDSDGGQAALLWGAGIVGYTGL
jgi:hypothetical protein